MQQIKIFKGVETDLATLERDINAWLKSSKAKVQTITGNIAPQSPQVGGSPTILGAERMSAKTFVASDILIAILYEA